MIQIKEEVAGIRMKLSSMDLIHNLSLKMPFIE